MSECIALVVSIGIGTLTVGSGYLLGWVAHGR